MPGVTLVPGVMLPDPVLEGVECATGVALFELLLLPLHAVKNRGSKASILIARHKKGREPITVLCDASTLNIFFAGQILSIPTAYSPCQICTVVSGEAGATSWPGFPV